MAISAHTNFRLDPANPTYEGEWKRLLKVAENEPLWLYSIGRGANTSGLRAHIDNKGNLAIGYGYDFAQNKTNSISDLRAAGAVIADEAQLQTAISGLTRGGATAVQQAAIDALVYLPDEATATRLLEQAVISRKDDLNDFLIGNQVVLGESRELLGANRSVRFCSK